MKAAHGDIKAIWNNFEKSFKDTYTNLAKKVNAQHSLETLKMEKGDIATYIATFLETLDAAGYQKQEQGAVIAF